MTSPLKIQPLALRDIFISTFTLHPFSLQFIRLINYLIKYKCTDFSTVRTVKPPNSSSSRNTRVESLTKGRRVILERRAVEVNATGISSLLRWGGTQNPSDIGLELCRRLATTKSFACNFLSNRLMMLCRFSKIFLTCNYKWSNVWHDHYLKQGGGMRQVSALYHDSSSVCCPDN